MNFSVYNLRLVIKNGTLINRQLIVLKQGKYICGWTDFHKYIKASKNKSVLSIETDLGQRPKNISKFLNYVFFDKYHIKSLNEISFDMVSDYLNSYGLLSLPSDNEYTHRKQSTVNIVAQHICDFLDEFTKYNNSILKNEELKRKVKYFNKKTGKVNCKEIPAFEIRCIDNNMHTLRDLPNSCFEIVIDRIKYHHTRILMLASMSAYAGTRPSEGCNVRREDSCLGPGIFIDTVEGEIKNIRIDLNHEYNLRSDHKPVSVGKIKKHRIQKVYPLFIEPFFENYQYYMNFIEGSKYEKDYGALTNNIKGMAMTYESYALEFSQAVKECIPIMLKSKDPEVAFYGRMLLENNIGPHILRHWFSVQLTVAGESIAGLMYWRGDKSEESSLTYIKNKSDLIKEYAKVNDGALDYLMWVANRKYGKENRAS